MEEMDYTKVLPIQPPEGLIPFVLAEGCLNEEYLVYRAGCYVDPLTGQRVQAVKLTCTCCEDSQYAEKVLAGGCHSAYASAPFGFVHPETDEATISNDRCLCPMCGSPVKVRHVGRMSGGLVRNYCHPMTVTRCEEKLALLGWCVERWFRKDEAQGFKVYPYEAYVVEEKKIVRLCGYRRCMSTTAWLGHWELRKGYYDKWGSGGLVFPWDKRLLEGSTAENSKLDLFFQAAGKDAVPVSYLRVWQKHPEIENLVMQGAGRLVADMIRSELTQWSGNATPRIPKMEGVQWGERSPAKMFGMTREEFRACVAGKWDHKDLKFWQQEAAAGRRLTQEEVELAKGLTFGVCNALVNDGLDWLRVARYLKKQKAKDRRCDYCILRDYWGMAQRIGKDLAVSSARYPSRLMEAHDRAGARLAEIGAELERSKEAERSLLFAARLEELDKLTWEKDGIVIRPAESETELKREGEKLDHCVGAYAQRHASGSTTIFFIRRASAPDTPWYTLELDIKTLEVKQNRGKRNCARTPEIEQFEAEWLTWLQAQRKKKRKKKHVAA